MWGGCMCVGGGAGSGGGKGEKPIPFPLYTLLFVLFLINGIIFVILKLNFKKGNMIPYFKHSRFLYLNLNGFKWHWTVEIPLATQLNKR